MKHYKILAFLSLISYLISCTTNTKILTIDEDIDKVVLSDKGLLIQHYTQIVVPLFKKYSDVEIPTEFIIDEKDITINAGATFGYVEVSRGLINYKNREIQIFVLAHEVAHIVTLKQAKLFNLEGAIPKGTITNDYKKSEFLADLIAFHLINLQDSEISKALINKLDTLEKLLGLETFTHPSGKNRIMRLNNYLENCKTKSEDEVFKTMFLEIWQLE